MQTVSDLEILARTQGLINYIRYLIKSDRSPVSNLDRYESVTWLAELPDTAADQANRDDNFVLALQYPVPKSPPQVPPALQGLIDEAAIADPNWSATRPAPESPAAIRAYGDWLPRYRD